MTQLFAKLGRARRTHFILALVVLGVGMAVTRMAIMFWFYRTASVPLLIGTHLPIDYPLQGTGWYFGALALINDAVILALAVMRMQDMDVSAIWILPAYLVVFALAWLSATLGVIAFFAAILVLIFKPGTIGPNRFGPDPRGWQSQAHFDEQVARVRAER